MLLLLEEEGLAGLALLACRGDTVVSVGGRELRYISHRRWVCDP